MNRNIEPVCGKIQVKGKDGLKGMSLPDIEKLIMRSIKGTNKEGEFKRYKTSIPKGVSKRLRYCAFIKDNLKNEWNKYNKKPANKPAKGPASIPLAIRELLKGDNNTEFVFDEEGATEMGNANNGGEREGGNYANNNNNGRMVFQQTTFPRGSRKANTDPFKNVQNISARLQARVATKLRKMKSRGEKIPPLKTREDMYKFVMLRKPGDVTRVARVPMKKSSDLRDRVKRMSMPSGISTAATGRVARVASVFRPVAGTKLSMPEIRKASDMANKLTEKVMTVGQNRNFMREVLKSNAPVDANRLATNIMSLEKFNRNSVRGVIRGYELNRAKVLKNIGAPIAKVAITAKNLPSGSSMIIPVTIAQRARIARLKKVANRTPEEKRALKAMDRLAKLKAARKRRFKPESVKMMETTRPLDLLSGSNRDSDSNSASSVRSVRMMGSNSNSNSNDNRKMNTKKMVAKGK